MTSGHASVVQSRRRQATPAGPPEKLVALVKRLRAMSFAGLGRMYDASSRTFVFRVRRTANGIVQEGRSLRYTAITLIGLAGESRDETRTLTGGHTADEIFSSLRDRILTSDNLGDVALTLFAGRLLGRDDLDGVASRLVALAPADRVHPVVELSWTLSALSLHPAGDVGGLRDSVADRLMTLFDSRAAVFPHVAGARGARSHVCCFADIIYPIQALAMYSAAAQNRRALEVSSKCAAHLCANQGSAGQWWWHYDYRTGDVLERYPVYAIHQDAMGPMGLFAVADAGGPDFSGAVYRGLNWLASAPELDGGSLVDSAADLIWRKVARREPRKAVRYLQAAAARAHTSWRIPAVDVVFPPTAIDHEDRPYHLGWLLYAWRNERETSLHVRQERA